MKRILVLNGPNLNLLGVREPEIYGRESYADLVCYIEGECAALGCDVDVFQSNHEGALVDYIQAARSDYDGIVLNPAAYTHTSVALLDAVKAVGIPTVEVHLSDVRQREDFRKISYVRSACIATIAGHGFAGYMEAVRLILDRLAEN